MEECEVLCNRLAIMVGGKFVCTGSSEELKQRFGTGFNIQIKINPENANDQLNEIKSYIVELLACQIIDEHEVN